MGIQNWAKGLGAIGFALALAGTAALAQAPTPAPKADTKAPAAPAAKAEKKAVKKSTPSACKGLDEKACGANTGCSWIKATKTKAGVDRKAYCRLKSTPPKKAPAKK